MEGLIGILIDFFSGINKNIIVFIISMLPILELRGGLLASALLNIDFLPAFIVCFIGNLLPIPLVLLFIEKIFEWLKKSKLLNKVITRYEKKVLSKKDQIDKYGYWGLLLFVGIPLPGTGAWTGSVLAVLLNLDKKKAFGYIILGVLMAGIIMSIVSYGILDNIIR